MMTPAQFQHYYQGLALPAEAVDFLARVRQSPPARRVQGRAGNVSGFYSSQKMGLTIQFESLVELGAIYLKELPDREPQGDVLTRTGKISHLSRVAAMDAPGLRTTEETADCG